VKPAPLVRGRERKRQAVYDWFPASNGWLREGLTEVPEGAGLTRGREVANLLVRALKEAGAL
jgi:hypothetical protein